jgi:aryl-alcohol dehydrogenase-like predicted oxidoreductase
MPAATFFDTANEIYADGRSEEILGRLVNGARDEVVIATKYSFHRPAAATPTRRATTARA